MKVVRWIVYNSPLAIDDGESPYYSEPDVIIKVGANAVCRDDYYGWRSDWGWIALEYQASVLVR